MTYQDFGQDFGRIVKKAASASLHLLDAIGRGVEGMRLYEALQRLPDHELAALGIERDGIARYVAEYMDPPARRRAGHGADVHPFAKTTAPRQADPAANGQRAAA